jgi:thiol-disulfide isomerase/thioredoxin
MLTMKARSIAIAGFLGAGALLVVLYGMWTSRVHAPARPPASLAKLVPVEKVAAVPAVAFEGADGKRHALSDFRGHYVLLNLWAVWCAPCVKELPALARLQGAMAGGRFEVVAVDVARGTPKDAADFLKSHDSVKLTPYIDPNLMLMRAFGAYGLPMTILIDEKGREIARAVGPAEWDAPESIDYFKALSAKAPS